jgi:protein gp37
MAGLSDIEWTDATWNPITGCAMVSPGCTNCYAMRMAARLQAMNHSSYKAVTRKSGKRPVWTGTINLVEGSLDIPLRWKKPRKVFVNSMSDLFQDGVPAAFVQRVWKTMEAANWHVFQVLTKRPDRMKEVIESANLHTLPNVWLGTSVESADYIDRISVLGKIPCAVRFISFEPLLGPVGKVDLFGVDWAIVGGESGPGARPIKPSWVEEIRRQCRKSDTAFFFKQWGGKNKKVSGRLFRGRTWDEYPTVSEHLTETMSR